MSAILNETFHVGDPGNDPGPNSSACAKKIVSESKMPQQALARGRSTTRLMLSSTGSSGVESTQAGVEIPVKN